MTIEELVRQARETGFLTALVEPEQIPVNPKFRSYCQDNLCGKYNANYACPPACGTAEQLHGRLLEQQYILILEKLWPIRGYEDKQAMACARRAHNAAVLALMEAARAGGFDGFSCGYNGCPLCEPCRQTVGEPCPFPDKRISCMSAFCVDVAELARRCDLPFAWSDERLHLFGMLALHKI